jgi:hypothetical protein
VARHLLVGISPAARGAPNRGQIDGGRARGRGGAAGRAVRKPAGRQNRRRSPPRGSHLLPGVHHGKGRWHWTSGRVLRLELGRQGGARRGGSWPVALPGREEKRPRAHGHGGVELLAMEVMELFCSLEAAAAPAPGFLRCIHGRRRRASGECACHHQGSPSLAQIHRRRTAQETATAMCGAGAEHNARPTAKLGAGWSSAAADRVESSSGVAPLWRTTARDDATSLAASKSRDARGSCSRRRGGPCAGRSARRGGRCI